MENEEIAVKLTALEHEAKSAKHRIDDLEVQNQAKDRAHRNGQ